MSGTFDLARFVRAQAGVYPRALAELRGGAKKTHWMWFVFPQVLGLGHSDNARFFAISGRPEAQAYLDHELLGVRLHECTRAMLGWSSKKTALEILGPIDALKFHSSMTLFDAIAGPGFAFTEALDAFYEGSRDGATLDFLDD